MDSVHLKLDGEVMLYRWYDTRDKLEEEEETILDTRFSSIALNLLNHFLHHRCVITRMDAELTSRELGMSFKGDCFLGVICHDILEHFILCQELTILGVALQP